MATDLLRPPPRAIAAAARAAVLELGRPLVVGTYRDLRRPPARLAPPSVVVNERLGVWMLRVRRSA